MCVPQIVGGALRQIPVCFCSGRQAECLISRWHHIYEEKKWNYCFFLTNGMEATVAACYLVCYCDATPSNGDLPFLRWVIHVPHWPKRPVSRVFHKSTGSVPSWYRYLVTRCAY